MVRHAPQLTSDQVLLLLELLHPVVLDATEEYAYRVEAATVYNRLNRTLGYVAEPPALAP